MDVVNLKISKARGYDENQNKHATCACPDGNRDDARRQLGPATSTTAADRHLATAPPEEFRSRPPISTAKRHRQVRRRRPASETRLHGCVTETRFGNHTQDGRAREPVLEVI